MSTDILEYKCNGIQYHSIINMIEAQYNIHYHVKQRRVEWKGYLLSTRNMSKGLHKSLEAVVNELSESLPILGESGSEVSYLIPEPRKFT